MLGAHPLVCTKVEQSLYSKYTVPWIGAWEREAKNIEQGRRQQGLPFLWTEEFYNFLREFVARVYQRVGDANPQATHVLDKRPGYSIYVEDIHRTLPEARFLHVIRDGRDVAVSMVATRKRSGFGRRTIQGAAASWREHVYAARAAAQYHEQYLEVRYESMLADGVGTLTDVLDFCGLPTSVEKVTAIVREHQFDRMKAR
jgi:hypothetical protein